MGARGGGSRKMAAGGSAGWRVAPGRAPALMLAAAAAALGFLRVSALDVKTPEELFVENGTEARFPCTFSSSDEISSAMSVSWSFQPEGAMTPISFFYYSQGNTYHGKDTPFKNRISWAGDLNKKDASVSIANVQFRDNGTYFCDVKNPPDIVVKPGEIRLRVVQRVRVSAVEEKTPEELFVENGTEARLPCPFSSSEVISSATSVSWSFQPEGAMTPIPNVLCRLATTLWPKDFFRDGAFTYLSPGLGDYNHAYFQSSDSPHGKTPMHLCWHKLQN
ncbi:myelin protein zero-like protein 1 isoform X3 [Chrysemys picta bellii]|uniref:myelin protein zero-like protein 1 isoform X3 n=1 Tax=Chrysemys picta bellii TaxID=8478 RepID=UPI0032B0F6AA